MTRRLTWIGIAAALVLPAVPAAGQEAMGGMAMPATAAPSMPAMQMGVGGGAYQPGSGTARMPAAEGAMVDAAGWTLMAHGYA